MSDDADDRKAARTITIEIFGPNDFDVSEGGRFSDHLCWDEMLGQIAHITHPAIGKARYEMLTAEEHRARQERRKQPPDISEVAGT